MEKRRTAPEIIGFHLGWDIRDVSEGRYQRHCNPAVYVCGSRYYCAPTAAQFSHNGFMKGSRMSNGQDIACDGPFKLEMEVYFEITDGPNAGRQAQAKFNLKPGTVPTDDYIKSTLAYAEKQVGSNMRLLTRHEFVRATLSEQNGVFVNVAVPGPDQFRLFDIPTPATDVRA